jgi:hypothetical protein
MWKRTPPKDDSKHLYQVCLIEWHPPCAKPIAWTSKICSPSCSHIWHIWINHLRQVHRPSRRTHIKLVINPMLGLAFKSE